MWKSVPRIISAGALSSLVAFGCRGQSTASPEPPSRGDTDSLLETEYAASGHGGASEGFSQADEQPTRPPGSILRSELYRATNGGKAGYLLAQLRPVAHRPRGSFQGWEITAVFPDDPELCASCDLQVGDVIVSVNGSKLQRPEQLGALVEQLDRLDELHVRLVRDQTLHETRYPIVD